MQYTPFYIEKDIADSVAMVGNYYKHNHPGGISSVVQYWSKYIPNLHYYPSYRLSNLVVRLWYFIFSFLKLFFNLIFDKKIKILHLHTAADGSFFRKCMFLKLGKLFNKKVVFHIHASRFKDFYNESKDRKKNFILNNLKKADIIIVLSESWKNWFKEIGIDETKIIILHNITDYPQFKESEHVNDGKLHLLFMGEIGERKGVFDVLNAISLKKEVFNGRLMFKIGGNKNEELLKSKINELSIQSMVSFEGWVSGEKKTNLLSWSDVFILPSRNEGLPISILEAMSYDDPIISTHVGGIPEIVKDGENGILVEIGNKEQIADAIELYVNNKETLSKQGAVSQSIVSSYYPETVMKSLNSIYLNLLSN